MFHKVCYCAYTSASNLKHFPSSTASPADDATPDESPSERDDAESHPRPSRSALRSSVPGTDRSKCLFCQSQKKLRDRKTIEGLTRCLTMEACERIKEAARLLNDERLQVAVTGTDLIAKDVIYHKSCYRDKTRAKTLDRLREKQVKEETGGSSAPPADPNLPTATALAATRLDDVEQGVIHGGLVVRLAQICRTYDSYLSQAGIDAPPFRAEHMRRHLEERFGDQGLVTTPRSRKDGALVYCDTSKGDLVSALIKPSDHVQEGKESLPSQVPLHTTENQDLYHAAALLRSELLAVQDQMSWPPTLDSVSEDVAMDLVPSSLYNVLAWIVDNDDRTRQDVPADGTKVLVHNVTTRQQVLSMAQDLLYCTRGGRVKTPKHVLLPLTVQHLTKNTELLTLINKFGHGMSRSQIEEMETALAEQALAAEEGVPLPSHIDRTVSVVMEADNNDFLEETRTGANTTHCTTSIVIQRAVSTARGEPQPPRHQRTRHRRSLSVAQYQELPDYNAGVREGPPSFHLTMDALEEVS